MNLKIFLNQVREITNIFGRLKFVACDHHYRDSSLLESCNSLWNLVLKLVFNGSCSKNVKIGLSLFNESKFNLFDFSRCDGFIKLMKGNSFFGLLIVFIFINRHFPVTKNKCPQALNSVLINVGLKGDLMLVRD
jgi:hypothetical protein